MVRVPFPNKQITSRLLTAACVLLITSCEPHSKVIGSQKSGDKVEAVISRDSMTAGTSGHLDPIKGRLGLTKWLKASNAGTDTLSVFFVDDATFGQWMEAAAVIGLEGFETFRFGIKSKAAPADAPPPSLYKYQFPAGNIPWLSKMEDLSSPRSGAIETVTIGEETYCLAAVHVKHVKNSPPYLAGTAKGPWETLDAEIKKKSAEKPGTQTVINVVIPSSEPLSLLSPILTSCIDSRWILQISTTADKPGTSDALPGD